MNYIWYPLIEAIRLGYDTKKLRYRAADMKFHYTTGDEEIWYNGGSHHVSPLLEYIPLVLYDSDKTVKDDDKFSRVDVNPYHRFGAIFEHILRPGRSDPNDLIVCDIITHILAHLDTIRGMSKRDFRIMLVIDEIESGCFGGAEYIAGLFSVAEKRALAEALIMLYETGNCLRCLDSLFSTIMTDFNILLRDNKEVVFYNPYAPNEREDKKLRFIIKLLLPIDLPYVIHWRHTYGSIEHPESMALEEFVL